MPVQRTPPPHLQPPVNSLESSSSYSSLINTPSKAPPSPFGTRKSALPRTPPDGKRSAEEGDEGERSVKRARLSPPGVVVESTTPTQAVPRRSSSRPSAVVEEDQRVGEAAEEVQATEEELQASVAQHDTQPTPITTPPPPPTAAAPDTNEDYGRHHRVLLQALEVAVRKGANKWTADDLKACFPLLSSQNPKAFEDVWTSSAQNMRETILSHAHGLLEDYKAGPLLKLLNEVVEDAKAAGDEERLGVWRPDVSPEALTAANNLPIFDEAYRRLYTEHEDLHRESSVLYEGLQKKQAELEALEAEIKDAVSELDGTLEALEGFPSEGMQEWTENTAGHLENQRAPDRVQT